MSRIALLTECRVYNEQRNFEEQLIAVGGNTGNNAYVTALKDIFGAEHVNYGQLDKVLSEDRYDIYIVGNLSWIVENSELPSFYHEAFRKIISKGKRFVPISVGTQVVDYKSDFKYHPNTLKLLKDINEQAIIACRGEYTLELLHKNGIKNAEAVGCPSLFHTKDYKFKVNKRNKLRKNAFVATGITPWASKHLSIDKIKEFFMYAKRNNVDFIEQANTKWIEHITKLDKQFSNELLSYLDKNNKIFFNIEEWRDYSRELDFTFGGRFHGNVIPLLEGVPALFITIDARTREMTEYLKLPSIDIRDFKFDMSIEQLYDLTDYTKFNSSYTDLYIKFERLANKNGLWINY